MLLVGNAVLPTVEQQQNLDQQENVSIGSAPTVESRTLNQASGHAAPGPAAVVTVARNQHRPFQKYVAISIMSMMCHLVVVQVGYSCNFIISRLHLKFREVRFQSIVCFMSMLVMSISEMDSPRPLARRRCRQTSYSCMYMKVSAKDRVVSSRCVYL